MVLLELFFGGAGLSCQAGWRWKMVMIVNVVCVTCVHVNVPRAGGPCTLYIDSG